MTEIYVGTDAQLNTAIKNAQPGDTIYLAPGTYAPIAIKSGDLGISITSLDPDDPAILTGLNMRNASGIAFSNLKMEAAAGTHNIFSVFGATNVSFDSIEVYGPDNLGSGQEVSPFIIRESTHVSVTNSEFHHVQHGVQLLDVEYVTVDGNSFHDIRTDGVRGGGVSNSQISNNHFTDFYPAEGDHPDGIQLWSTQQTKAAENILITGNVIARGDGEPIQGIFIRDTYSTLPFKNVTVTDNAVLGGAYNGITVDGVIDGTITDNLVAGYEDQRSWIRVIRDQDTDVSGNTATFYVFDTRDSGHFNHNQSIPEKGVDYASLVPDADGDGGGFLTLRPAELTDKAAQLAGQDPASNPPPPTDETPDPAPEPGIEEPPVEQAPEPETPAEPETPPASETPPDPADPPSPPMTEEDGEGTAPPPPLTGEQPSTGDDTRAIHVSTDTELKAAIKDAQPGDTIYLATGSYAPLIIRGVALDLTITSADSANPAIMTGLTMRDASGVTFSNLTMSASLGTHNAFTVLGASDVSFDGITMHGPANMGSGKEVSPFIIRESERVSVTNSEFHDVKQAIQLLNVENVAISGNSFSDIGGGAVRGSGVSNSQITDNHFSSFHDASGSAGAIQLNTTQQAKSAHDIVITGNVIVRGDGDPMQAIFIRDQGGKLPYQDLTVTDNVVLGGAYNAIMIDGVEGGIVKDNLVAGYDDQRSWIRVITDKDTIVSDNIATAYEFGNKASPHFASNQKISESGMNYSALEALGADEIFAALRPDDTLDTAGVSSATTTVLTMQLLDEIRSGDGGQGGGASADYFLFHAGDSGGRPLDAISDFPADLYEGMQLHGAGAGIASTQSVSFAFIGDDPGGDGTVDFVLLPTDLSSLSVNDFLL